MSEKIQKNDWETTELKAIKKEDQKKNRNLYETLFWYLKMKRNVSQTAAKMRIHRNTLLPRLARINEIMKLDDKDGMECERLLLIMEIEMMNKKRGKR